MSSKDSSLGNTDTILYENKSYLQKHVVKKKSGCGVRQLAYEPTLRLDVLFGDAFHDMLDALQRVPSHAHQRGDAFPCFVLPS